MNLGELTPVICGSRNQPPKRVFVVHDHEANRVNGAGGAGDAVERGGGAEAVGGRGGDGRGRQGCARRGREEERGTAAAEHRGEK